MKKQYLLFIDTLYNLDKNPNYIYKFKSLQTLVYSWLLIHFSRNIKYLNFNFFQWEFNIEIELGMEGEHGISDCIWMTCEVWV